MFPLPARLWGHFAGRKQANNINFKDLRLFSWPLGLEHGHQCLCESGMAGRTKVRVPNPAKPLKGRLDAPPAQPHLVKKKYRRRPKHPGRGET
jgi:hypothetical protein